MNIEKSFRPVEHISNDQKEAIDDTTDRFVALGDVLNFMPESREKSICLTKLQEAKFWAIECICKNPVN